MKILLAMSGGIDSSVCAHLLKAQGHEVIGVRFTLWTDPLAPEISQVLPSKCCNTQNINRCSRVCEELEIPLHILDLEEEFKTEVVDPFLEGYRKGKTPNPCINCNRTLKFGRLLEMMKELECEKLATGHYARVAYEETSPPPVGGVHEPHLREGYLLLEAIDKSKDQSYYLYGLSQSQLSRITFPLGGMLKEEVYRLADEFGVPFEHISYRESQDLCFFPEKEPKDFLKRHLEADLEPGNIVRTNGEILGEHQGLPLYTIGQRRIGVGGNKIPLEVVSKNIKSNELIVEDQGKEKIESIELSDLRFVSWKPQEHEPVEFDCRLRSLAARSHGHLEREGDHGRFVFDEPQSPQAEGQCLVLYRGEEVVGGGVMRG